MKVLLFTFIVLLPAVIVGISNFLVFPDSSLAATIMLIVTVGVAAIFTWQSGNATKKISRYCILADIAICLILCANLACHWILAREVSAAQQGVVERHTEEDREDKRANERADRELKLKHADLALQEAERKRLVHLPVRQRRSVLEAKPTPANTPEAVSGAASVIAPAPAVKLTPEQVRQNWWWTLTGLAIAEVAASVLAGAILAGIWEWDRNRDGVADHLQQPRQNRAGNTGGFPAELPIDERATGPLPQRTDAGKVQRR